jgi:hypothetical protein
MPIRRCWAGAGGDRATLRHANPLDTMLPVLQLREAPLQAHFEAFFPQLQAFARAWIELDAQGAHA